MIRWALQLRYNLEYHIRQSALNTTISRNETGYLEEQWQLPQSPYIAVRSKEAETTTQQAYINLFPYFHLLLHRHICHPTILWTLHQQLPLPQWDLRY